MSNLKNKKQITKVNKTIKTHSNFEKSLSFDDKYWASTVLAFKFIFLLSFIALKNTH